MSEKKEPQEESPSEKKSQLDLFPSFIGFSAGKDEMNIAEFPIATLSRRIDPNVKTLKFQDEVRDDKTRKMIKRTLTITGSDLYGLPASFDDEVILGLINLTKIQGFSSRELLFNRHQIITVLGWKNDDYYYGRIKESIERWLGVTLYYDNAWREIGKDWKSGGFNLITSVTWGKRGEPSKIIWGEDIFTSFERGNLKALDLGLYRQISTPTARRLYRFLDKRFGTGRHSWTMLIDKLAFNKLGMGRDSYKDVAQVKRHLLSAIKVLEKAEFIMEMAPKERFRKITKGVWEVHFQKFKQNKHKDQTPLPIEIAAISEPEAKLVELGVERTQAQKLIRTYGDERVLNRIEIHIYRQKTNQTGWMKDETAVLIGSIKKDEYQSPKGFISSADKAAQKAQELEKKRKAAQAKVDEEKALREQSKARDEEIRSALKVYDGLSREKQEQIREKVNKEFNFTNETVIRNLCADEITTLIETGELENSEN